MYETFTLKNGLRIIAEPIDHFHSVSVGLWVAAGSMHETREENGLSHFLEHMMFKGTEKRSAKDIAVTMDSIGGQINAFTGKDCTCYYAKVIDEHLPVAMDVLCDLLRHSVLDQAELEKERGVILEEIAMVEDTPDDIVHDLLSEAAYQGSALAQTILGPAERIGAFGREDLETYRQAHYRPENTVLAVAGRYHWEALLQLAEQHLADWEAPAAHVSQETTPAFVPALRVKSKEVEQVHVCIGYPGIALGEDDAYPLSIFNNILGGGMSSRLFQRIREESGMAYSVYSYPTALPGSGLFTLYAGTSAQHVDTVLSMLREEVEGVLEKGVTEEEFIKAREQLKGAYILGQESTSGRMSGIGRGTLLLNRVRDEDEVLRTIARITMEDVMRVARQVLHGPNAASVVGRDAQVIAEDRLLWRAHA